ncbi:hypothetical protein GLYMA_05G218200v4 [Glycine max]|uniref:Chaperone DnaJ C-terminal domain-containing protein n=2 Tax=Glycine subgen. Soja TaxID=1462606 RepID=K7KRV5_SOYBN|nr:hypothetical protein GYH30_013423 [Glycine max]KRH60063.1 hypothetical protein GLYMA_05G218200v4 [Glycine max]RZC13694.1 DnaJ-like subfamily B member 1 [Glycine soja]
MTFTVIIISLTLIRRMQWWINAAFFVPLKSFTTVAKRSIRSQGRTVSDKFGVLKSVEEILKIDIKPGWENGTKITFPGKGNKEQGAPADLVFVLGERPHAIFKRDRNDLVVIQKILLADALTGTSLNLTTSDGRDLTIQVTDIVKSGYELVVPNEGMPISKKPGKKENLRIKFDVICPSRLTTQQKCDLRRIQSDADY